MVENKQKLINNLIELQNKINYKFKNIEILKHALTHTSYANEFCDNKKDSNERLEFLGDSILEMVSSEYFFNEYKDLEEGELTKLRATYVCEHALAISASEFELSKHILLGKGEEKSGGRNRESIVSDSLEALIAAIYLDGGFEKAKKFILDYILNYKVDMYKDNTDYKTELQVLMQRLFDSIPHYILLEESGPDHDKHFIFGISYKNNIIATGSGRSKKIAEQNAAKEALIYLKK